MYQLADILGVTIAFLFADVERAGEAEKRSRPSLIGAVMPVTGTDTMSKLETRQFVRAYYRIADRIVRRRLFDLIKSISGQTPSRRRRRSRRRN
jgi:hypothetical protein